MPRFSERKWKRPKIEHGKPTKYNWVVLCPENLKLGKFTDIGAFTLIDAKYGVEIQDRVQIGGGCKIYSHSTIDKKKGKVTIKLNAKVGANSVVMPGVTIGKNSVVGALSLANRDIPPNEIWAGVPVKRLGTL